MPGLGLMSRPPFVCLFAGFHPSNGRAIWHIAYIFMFSTGPEPGQVAGTLDMRSCAPSISTWHFGTLLRPPGNLKWGPNAYPTKKPSPTKLHTNNFQKKPKLSDFPILNCKRANWDLVWLQEKNSEPVINDLPWADALFLLDSRGVSMECVSEAKTKTKQTFTKSKTLPCSKKLVSLFKSF